MRNITRPMLGMEDSCFLNASSKNLRLRQAGCFLPISSERIGGVVDLVRLKHKEIELGKTINNITEEILSAQDAEFRLQLQQMFVTAAYLRFVSPGFTLHDFFNIRFKLFSCPRAWAQYFPWYLVLLYRRKGRGFICSPDFKTPQHLQHDVHGGSNLWHRLIAINKQRRKKHTIFYDECEVGWGNQSSLITHPVLNAGPIMVVPVPVNDMIVVEKRSFLFGKIPAGNPLPIGISGCGGPTGSRNSGVPICFNAIPKKVLDILCHKPGCEVERLIRVKCVEIALGRKDSFFVDLHRNHLMIVFTNRKRPRLRQLDKICPTGLQTGLEMIYYTSLDKTALYIVPMAVRNVDTGEWHPATGTRGVSLFFPGLYIILDDLRLRRRSAFRFPDHIPQ